MPRRGMSKPSSADGMRPLDEQHTLKSYAIRTNAMPLSLNTFRTSLGWCAMLGEGETLYALTFGHQSVAAAVKWLDKQSPESSAADARSTKWNPRLAKRLTAM